MAKLNVEARSCTRRLATLSSMRMPPCVGSFASTMFSATVITGMSMKCWCTIPIPASIASFAEAKVTGFPSRRISPESGW